MSNNYRELANFIWSICNLLRGPGKRNEYRKVILPMTVLGRFDCLLAPRKRERIISKIFDNEDFGYHNITVGRPLQLNFQANAKRTQRIEEESGFKNLAISAKKDPAIRHRQCVGADRCGWTGGADRIVCFTFSLTPRFNGVQTGESRNGGTVSTVYPGKLVGRRKAGKERKTVKTVQRSCWIATPSLKRGANEKRRLRGVPFFQNGLIIRLLEKSHSATYCKTILLSCLTGRLSLPILNPTIPARPLYNAQIGGLLFSGGIA